VTAVGGDQNKEFRGNASFMRVEMKMILTKIVFIM